MQPAPGQDNDFPWWLVALGAIGAWLFWEVLSDGLYRDVLAKLMLGVQITLLVTLVAYVSACAIGLALALASRSRYLAVRQAARFYIEVVRGIPILVLLLYIAFVFAPVAVEGWNLAAEALGLDPIRARDFPLLWRAVIALTVAYSAFLAEIFRAGLQAVDKGQIEAAQSLGLSRWMTFRHVVFPQAFRVILPPLGNDLVAMVKDSSLVSVLGVSDITQLGKVIAAGNFRYFETYNVVALLYLTMTISLSLLVRQLERHLRRRTGGRDG
ncbi:MAG: amino acid ABC transporter permease [Rhodobacteraceae bacterium]|nr:amino acid ABC transporter permease [Paracoccaceae bacterium]